MINLQNIDRNDLTICAPSTAQGGAIGVIRVSGAKAFNIVDGIFSPVSKNTWQTFQQAHAHLEESRTRAAS